MQLAGELGVASREAVSAVRLGFFGGSFDPPHCGHLAIARAAAERFSLDRVLLAPTGRQPLKRAGAEASFADRLAMCRLLCEGDARLVPSELDAPRADGAPNYTVRALEALHKEHRQAALFAVIGADALPELPRWYEASRLFELATWIAVSRPGFQLAPPWPATLQTLRDVGRLSVLDGVEVPVSSTELRRKLYRSIEPKAAELPAAVLRYIHAHGLYSAEGDGDLGAKA